MLLHLGHFGLFTDNITYIKHLGHPTSIIEFVSELLGQLENARSSLGLGSRETQELVGDMMISIEEEDDDDLLGGEGSFLGKIALGGDKFSFKSSFACVFSFV